MKRVEGDEKTKTSAMQGLRESEGRGSEKDQGKWKKGSREVGNTSSGDLQDE